MHILVAIDSFKGTMTSLQAGQAVARGLTAGLPRASVRVVPVSDGGEGLIDAFHAVLGGRRVVTACTDPMGRPVDAAHLQLYRGSGWEAVVEMASSSGLVLLAEHERDVMRASTRGVGDQLTAALEGGARSILVGAGGSATCDGGTGMLHSLGVRFLDGEGRQVTPGGEGMERIRDMDTGGLDGRILSARVLVACDVDNPMVGADGAARAFAPQKGASPAQVEALERGMVSFARVLERNLHVVVRDVPGGGAAGGLAAALAAVCGAQLAQGFPVVSEALGLEEMVARADLVVTGEGSMDAQTRRGKLPVGVARLALRRGVPVVAYCGRLDDPLGELEADRFARIWDLESAEGGAQAAMRGGAEALERLARSTAQEVSELAGA